MKTVRVMAMFASIVVFLATGMLAPPAYAAASQPTVTGISVQQVIPPVSVIGTDAKTPLTLKSGVNAVLNSYWFNLSGWGSNTLYIKAIGVCPGGFSVIYGGPGTWGSMVGAPVKQYGNTYYAYPTTQANAWYIFYMSCWNSSSPGPYIGYKVYYTTRGVIQAYRIS